jgi:para-aminobenzoate synthetase/4-amino-4-deoxychorismate lyase
LPGVLRHELIAAGKAAEEVLTIEDLYAADAVLLGNSVRGLVRAQPIDKASRGR